MIISMVVMKKFGVEVFMSVKVCNKWFVGLLFDMVFVIFMISDRISVSILLFVRSVSVIGICLVNFLVIGLLVCNEILKFLVNVLFS